MEKKSEDVEKFRIAKNVRRCGFQKGHTVHTSKKDVADNSTPSMWMPRLTQAEFTRVAKVTPGGLIEVPDAEGKSGGAKLMRPKKRVADDLTTTYLKKDDSQSEMRIMHRDKTTQMYNECIAEHASLIDSQLCAVPRFTVHTEVKVGLCWKQNLRCVKCGYTSKMFKLYHEVPTEKAGQRSAAPNVGLQVGLQESSTGIAKGRVIIASLDVPPPCRSSMQRTANKVGNATATMTLADLAKRRDHMKTINKLRGLPEDDPVNISMDSRYSSARITGSYHAGQNASQAIGVVVEQQSGCQDIVALHIQNKLCTLGASLRRRGFDVTCPGHDNCTATLRADENLSEFDIGKDIGKQFGSQNVAVRYVVTDGDARSAEGVRAGMSVAGMPCEQVDRQADTTHLEQALFRNVIKATFSARMFPRATAATRKEQRKMFALDVKVRCHRIHSDMHRMYNGNVTKVASLMPRVIETTLDCYGGDCKKCRYSSVVCSGGKGNWWKKSMYLQTGNLHYLNMTSADRITLRRILQLRLGGNALALTKLCLNTNRNEGLNRGLSASLPKNVNFSRNVKGRACAAIDRLNYGAGDSLLWKLETSKAPISKGGIVAKAVRQIQLVTTHNRIYRSKSSVRRRLR